LFRFWFGCVFSLFFFLLRWSPTSMLFPYTTLFRSGFGAAAGSGFGGLPPGVGGGLFFCPHGAKMFESRSALISEGEIRALRDSRSEEHTSELQSRVDLVCRLLLEKKNE